MAQITQNPDISEKLDVIIQAAQKVFGEYGFEKTSMKDIARELNISKASLYYYFLDKESLFTAVIQKEQKEFLRLLGEIINKDMPASDQLREYIVVRHNFFSVFLNLSKLRMNETYITNSFIHNLIKNLKDQEFELVTRIFSHGTESGEFRTLNPARTTKLFLDIISGLRIHALKKSEILKLSNPDEELLEELLEMKEIFINGIFKNN